jgi:acetate kinase
MKDLILVINAGSSSIKFSCFAKDDANLSLISRGQIEGIGVNPTFSAKSADQSLLKKQSFEKQTPQSDLLQYLLNWIKEFHSEFKLIAAGHRVVHGGSHYFLPQLMTPQVLEKLKSLAPLAPLHQLHNLAPIEALAQTSPDLPQFACFDTAFHSTNPKVFQTFFIPKEIRDQGVRRYGFHGLSYEYIQSQLLKIDPDLAQKKLVIAHLGSGASMCALNNGKSVTTSMGMTALDGLPMGTRPGQIDAGVILYLMQQLSMGPKEIENMLYKKSGLLGLSEISNDMRELEESTDPRAKEAIAAFVWRISQMTGQLIASIQGIDGFIFTGGIGENSKLIRREVSSNLAWLGVDLNTQANEAAKSNQQALLSQPGSKIKVYMIPTNEELMIAQHTLNGLIKV